MSRQCAPTTTALAGPAPPAPISFGATGGLVLADLNDRAESCRDGLARTHDITRDVAFHVSSQNSNLYKSAVYVSLEQAHDNKLIQQFNLLHLHPCSCIELLLLLVNNEIRYTNSHHHFIRQASATCRLGRVKPGCADGIFIKTRIMSASLLRRHMTSPASRMPSKAVPQSLAKQLL
jgi:hypothetical protein